MDILYMHNAIYTSPVSFPLPNPCACTPVLRVWCTGGRIWRCLLGYQTPGHCHQTLQLHDSWKTCNGSPRTWGTLHGVQWRCNYTVLMVRMYWHVAETAWRLHIRTFMEIMSIGIFLLELLQDTYVLAIAYRWTKKSLSTPFDWPVALMTLRRV